MLLHAVIVDLYYNSDMTHSRVDRAAPTYIVGVYACRNSLTLTLQKKFADTDQRIGTKKAWQRTRRSTTLVLFLESEHHAHRRQHSWSLNAGGLVAGALWLSELSACKPDEPLDSVYHSAACVAVRSPSRTWRLAQLSQLSPCGSEATGSTHSAGHTACPADWKATEAVSMQKLTGIVAWLGNDSQTSM